jgi:pimeloyl-ACP methyl ester carboxylesterase
VTAGEGSPAVVIVPALADNVLQWLHVLKECALETRACVYDRAGVRFWSDLPPHGRRTPDLMAADLHALLCAASIPPPYILVGHSLGGLVTRRFYACYPDMVAGILLIDSSHEEQARRIATADWRRGTARFVVEAARRQARILGVRRLADSLGLMSSVDAVIAREAPLEYADAARAIMLSSRQRQAAVWEILMIARTWQPPKLGSLPLTVLTRASSPWRGWPVWAQMQDELAALSSDSKHIQAERAGHYLHLDDPDLVVQAIRDLVRRCR